MNNTTNAAYNAQQEDMSLDGAEIWFYIGITCISVFGALGNACVVWLIATRACLQSTTNKFILSLGIADCLVSVFLTPTYITCHFLPCDHLLKGIFFELLLYSSVYNLCGVTIERYLNIVHPLKHLHYMSRRRALLLIALCWLLPLLNFALHFVWFFSESVASMFKGFTTVETILMVGLPCGLLVILYTRIFLVARGHQRRQATQLKVVNFNDDSLASHAGNRTSNDELTCDNTEQLDAPSSSEGGIEIRPTLLRVGQREASIVRDLEGVRHGTEESEARGQGVIMHLLRELINEERAVVDAPATSANTRNAERCRDVILSINKDRISVYKCDVVEISSEHQCGELSMPRLQQDVHYETRRTKRQLADEGNSPLHVVNMPKDLMNEDLDRREFLNDFGKGESLMNKELNRRECSKDEELEKFSLYKDVINKSNDGGDVNQLDSRTNKEKALEVLRQDLEKNRKSNLAEMKETARKYDLEGNRNEGREMKFALHNPTHNLQSSILVGEQMHNGTSHYFTPADSKRKRRNGVITRNGLAIGRRIRRRSRTPARTGVSTIGSVIGIFIICWSVSLYGSFCYFYNICESTNVLRRVTMILLLFNSAVNPIVYAMLKTDMRREFLKLYRGVQRKVSRDVRLN